MGRILKLIQLCALVAFAIYKDAQQLLQQPLPLTQKQHVDVMLGKTLSATLYEFEEKGIFPAPRAVPYLRLYARITGKATALKAGEYELSPGMSSFDLLALIVSGKTVLHELRLIEGWSFDEALAAIRANGDLVHTLKDADATAIFGNLPPKGTVSSS